MRKIEGIVLHWPAWNKSTLEKYRGQSAVDYIDKIHKQRGYKMIGYHYLVNKDENGSWKTYDGRPDSSRGAHTYGPGNLRIGISCLYPMDGGLEQGMLEEIAQLVSTLSSIYKFEINKETLTGHRDWMATECPGDHLYSKIDWLIARAKELKPKRGTGNQNGVVIAGENQVSEIDVDIEGQSKKGFLINSQTHIHVSMLRDLGLYVEYDADEHKVYVSRQKREKEVEVMDYGFDDDN